MKKFIFSILCVSVFFIGLGGLINQVGAKFKSDERALEIIKQAYPLSVISYQVFRSCLSDINCEELTQKI